MYHVFTVVKSTHSSYQRTEKGKTIGIFYDGSKRIITSSCRTPQNDKERISTIAFNCRSAPGFAQEKKNQYEYRQFEHRLWSRKMFKNFLQPVSSTSTQLLIKPVIYLKDLHYNQRETKWPNGQLINKRFSHSKFH